jgi:plastocyanin
MQRPIHSFVALLILACAAAACGEEGGGPPAGSQETVNIQDDLFSPSSLTVTTGTTVTWNWNGNNQHNVTWVAAGGPAPSPTQTDGSYPRVFNAAGSYDYYCSVHATATTGTMRGSISVN